MLSSKGTGALAVIALSAVLVAALVGTGVAGAAGAKPTAAKATSITLGSKNFTEEYVLGELYRQALEKAGYTVSYKGNIGSTELTYAALTSGKISAYPEYTGTILSVVFHDAKPPHSAAAVYSLAKSKLGAKGYSLSNPTPFEDKDAIAVTKATAAKYHLKTVADLAKIPGKVTLGGFPEFKTRLAGLVGLQTVYKLKNLSFKPFATVPVYQGLDSKSLLAADVFTTDYQLASKKYVLLTDPKSIFGFQQVALIYKKGALDSKALSTVNKVSRLLTTKAMISLNKAAGLQKIDPAKVASSFLKANGLG